MAANQAERHELGREGQRVAMGLVGGKGTTHKAPFDVVDFRLGIAYEVKTMSALSQDLKVHISDESMARKREFARHYELEMVLLVVVIHNPQDVKVYRGELTQSARVSQMQQINGR